MRAGRGAGRRLRGLIAGTLAIVAVSAAAPGAASASTIGVQDIEDILISGSGVMGGGAIPPYDTRVSGSLDGTPGFYASENGFLTSVSVSHWNSSPVTVKILVLSRGSADFLNVVQAPMTIVLPTTDSAHPLLTTQDVPAPTTITAGDRIGMAYVSGTATLHALVSNSSPVAVPGGFPSPLPGTEPGVGSAFDMTDSISGPLIQGTVSATPSTPTGPTQPQSKPLALPAKTPSVKGKNKKIETSAHCTGLGIRSTCTGTVTIELTPDGEVVSVTESSAGSSAGAKVLGSASYSIPDGATQSISIPLSKAGRSKLNKKGKLKAFLVFREELNGKTLTSSTPFTAKGKKAKKRKR
jgi:hypothetical protein